MNKEISRHQKRRERTRNQLIHSALELVLESGYDTLTIQNITDRADLGRGTFYIHFRDKEEIVWQIIKDGLDEADRKARENVGDILPPTPEYVGYLNMFRHAEQNKDLYRIMLGSKGSAMLTARVNNYLAEDLEGEIKRYGLYPDSHIPPKIIAQITTGAIIRLITWWLDHPDEHEPEELAKMLYDMLIKKTVEEK